MHFSMKIFSKINRKNQSNLVQQEKLKGEQIDRVEELKA
jgi:hypothetical protein